MAYAFEEIKRVMARDTLLSYPNFSEEFKIYTNASDFQLWAFIRQRDKPIVLYSKKLTDSQKRYTVTEKGMLSIVKTLK